MKRIFTIIGLLGCTVLMAQQPISKEGGITPDILNQIKESYKDTPSDRAVKNALAGTSAGVLATNADNAAMIDTHFSDRVTTKGITDQKSSGRCWLFSGLNVLRAQTIAKWELPDLVLSQGYVFFYDQLEKSNLFLQGVIDTRNKPFEDREVDWLFSNPISDGGTFTGVADLVSKYGCVPQDAFVETFSANSTSQMRQLLSLKLREDGLKLREAPASKVQQMKQEMLGEIYRMLVLFLGEPPTEFTWARCDGKDNIVETVTCTPREFYERFIGNDLQEGYVMLMNDPSRPYYKMYEISYGRHCYDGHNWAYLNLPTEDIKSMAIASIKAGKAMYFSCDVGKCFDRKKGTLDLDNFDYESLLGIEFPMDKAQRVRTHASSSSHAMTLMAVDINADGKPVKWMVENSWGKDSGYKGHLIMTDEWFDNYMFRLVVEKEFVPEKLQSLLKTKPILLPAWDPMFSMDE